MTWVLVRRHALLAKVKSEKWKGVGGGVVKGSGGWEGMQW